MRIRKDKQKTEKPEGKWKNGQYKHREWGDKVIKTDKLKNL